MMILLSLLLPHQIISFTYYKINPIDNSSGIFYNHLGTARISNNKLTLLSHLNLTFLDEAWNIKKSEGVQSRQFLLRKILVTH